MSTKFLAVSASQALRAMFLIINVLNVFCPKPHIFLSNEIMSKLNMHYIPWVRVLMTGSLENQSKSTVARINQNLNKDAGGRDITVANGRPVSIRKISDRGRQVRCWFNSG